MKKIFAMLLAVFMLLGLTLLSISPAVAAATPIAAPASHMLPADEVNSLFINQAKALEVLRAAFPEIITGKELATEFAEEGHGNNPCWEFKLKGEWQGPGFLGSEITADVNALTGDIINFHYNPQNPQADYYRGKTVRLTREQAYPIAQEFLQKIQPDKAATLVLKEYNQSYYDPQAKVAMYYSFYWYRQVNGIKVDWDNIYIGVDAVTGKVTHYTLNWHNAEFPKVEKTLAKAELTAKLLSEVDLYPTYRMKPDDSASGIYSPVYRLNTNSQFYDSQTGQFLKQDGTNLAEKDKRIFEHTFNPQADTKQQETLSQPNQKINPELAKKTAEEFLQQMGITGELRRSGGGTSGGPGYTEEFWSYSPVKNNYSSRFGNGPEVSINAYTGQISRFENYTGQNQPGATNISYAEALSKAQDAIQKINPEIKYQLVLQQQLWDEEPDDVYNFNFARLLNGISCPGGIRIAISKQNGQICSYSIERQPFKTAKHSNIITPAKAREIFQNQQPFELAYIFPINPNRDDGASQMGAPILVYRSTELYQVDALSGEMTGWGWENKSSANRNVYTGHWAAAALSLLNESRLIPDGIKPEDTLTRRQALRILVAAAGRSNYYSNDQDINLAFTDIAADDPDRTIFQQAVKKGIINNQGKLNPNQNISREEMAVWLVNCLGYQDIARMKNAIAVPFKDVNQIASDKINYAGLVDGLGLMGANSEQNFCPQSAVTWAEMATAATQMATVSKNQGRY